MEVREQAAWASDTVRALRREIGRAIVGHEEVVHDVLVCLFCGGHALLEGVPGLGKTTLIKSLGQVLDLVTSRIQFTPDLMPADIIGTNVLVPEETQAAGAGTETRRYVRFQKGPVFANIVLADEINRATPKTQSALLEAMQERQVTIGDVTYPLPDPFLVLATQNPIEQEGTYPLPEAQVDRFMLKVIVGYPERGDERRILDRMAGPEGEPRVERVIRPDEILRARDVARSVYVVDLVDATRNPTAHGLDLAGLIRFGASPRATLFLVQAAKAHAFIRRRGFVTPEDIKAIGQDVLRHRILLSYEAEAEEITPEEVIRRVFDAVEVP
jgi:MoxR-like ATPase